MKDKRKRIKHLRILNAVLRGDMDTAMQIHNKSKHSLRLLFVMDRKDSDRYTLLSDAPEFSNLDKGRLFTRDEAIQTAENYSGCVFIDRASKASHEFSKSDYEKLSHGPREFDEKIIVSASGATRITDTSYTPKPGEKVRINVNLIN